MEHWDSQLLSLKLQCPPPPLLLLPLHCRPGALVRAVFADVRPGVASRLLLAV